jgi:hypothetical protein
LKLHRLFTNARQALQVKWRRKGRLSPYVLLAGQEINIAFIRREFEENNRHGTF